MQKIRRWRLPQRRTQNVSSVRGARESNQAVDILARMGAKRDPVPPNTFVERLFKPSMMWQDESGNTVLELIIPPDSEHSPDIIGGSGTEITPSAHKIMVVIAPWTEPFLAYLTRNELPGDQTEARRIVRRSKDYKVPEGELY